MKKMILAGILSVFAILAYGQNSIQMKGVEGINQVVLNRIITELSVKTRAQIDSLSKPLETNKFSIAHKDIDTGNFINFDTSSERGRAQFKKYDTVAKKEDGTTLATLTPFSISLQDGYIVTSAKETRFPKNYAAHTKQIAVFFDINQNMISIEGLTPEEEFTWNDNPNKKYLTVIFLSQKIQ